MFTPGSILEKIYYQIPAQPLSQGYSMPSLPSSEEIRRLIGNIYGHSLPFTYQVDSDEYERLSSRQVTCFKDLEHTLDLPVFNFSDTEVTQEDRVERPSKRPRLTASLPAEQLDPIDTSQMHPAQGFFGSPPDKEAELDFETLSNSSAVSSTVNQLEVIERLSRLRHVAIAFSEGISAHYLEKMKDMIEHTSKYEQQLQQWDESISEMGIPSNIDILVQGRRSVIYIKEAAKQGDFIGALAGSISCLSLSDHKSIPFATFSKGTFYLNQCYEGNFLQDLPTSQDGNVRLKLIYDEHTRELYFILVARKKIKARENLILHKFTPISF